MSISFSPYHPLIFAAVLLSLPIFYLLGAFFTPRFQYPLRNIAVRSTMGALVFTVANAIGHAGLHTMLLPFGALLPFLFKVKPEGLICDLKTISAKYWVISCLAIVGLLLLEMSFTDIRDGKDIIIGNWDYASSGGLGYDFYNTSPETMRFLWNHAENRAFHHHGDYWFAGFFSQNMSVLPYYSYIIVYRVVFELLLSMLLFSWIVPFSGGRIWLTALLSVFVLLVPGLQYLPGFGLIETALGLFPPIDILWNCVPYLLAAAGVVLFSLMIAEGKLFIGLMGLMLLPAFHPGLSLIAPAAALFLIVMKLISNRFARIWNEILFSYTQLAMALVAAMSTYFFASLDGRMYPLPSGLLALSYISQTIYTVLLTLLSTLYFLPFMWGVWYLFRSGSSKILFWIHAGLYLGAVVSFSMIYPFMKGDSEQILIMYVTALLIPAGSVGLFTAAFSENRLARGIALVALVCCLLAASIRLNQIRGGSSLHDVIQFSLGFDEEWKSRSRMSAIEANLFRSRLSGKPLTDIGIVVYEDSTNGYKEPVFLNHLPYLRGILPGAEFHRLNIIPEDTFEGAVNMPLRQFFKRSNLYHFFHQPPDSLDLVQQMEGFLKPDYLLLDTANSGLCMPSSLAKTYTQYDTLGRFILVSKP